MKLFQYIIILFLIISCNEKDLIIDLDQHESKLVVNGLISPSDSLHINISKSIPMLSEDMVNFVGNAEVQLYCLNEYLSTLSPGNDGMYYSKASIKEGKEYSINIHVPGYKSVKASCEIPIKPEILSLYTEHIDEDFLYCEIEFKNDLSAENFYLLEVETEHPILDKDSVLTHHAALINSDLFVVNGDLGAELERLLFSGEILQDSIASIGFAINKNKILNSSTDKSNTLYIHFMKISEEYYKYVISYYAAVSRQDEVYSNIENGYGIFGGYNTTIDSILVSD